METIVGLGALDERIKALSSPEAKRRYLGRTGLEVVREAKHLVARKTGNTGRTIGLGTVTEDSVTVSASGAAVYLEHGTRPHRIYAKGKALRFATSAAGRRLTGSPRKGAAVAFVKWVDHPGTQAKPFLRPAAEAVIARLSLAEEVVKNWNSAA